MEPLKCSAYLLGLRIVSLPALDARELAEPILANPWHNQLMCGIAHCLERIDQRDEYRARADEMG